MSTATVHDLYHAKKNKKPAKVKTTKVSAKGPHFVLYQDKTGQYRFNFKSSNNKIMFQGEPYTTLRDCERAVTRIEDLIRGNGNLYKPRLPRVIDTTFLEPVSQMIPSEME